MARITSTQLSEKSKEQNSVYGKHLLRERARNTHTYTPDHICTKKPSLKWMNQNVIKDGSKAFLNPLDYTASTLDPFNYFKN